MNEYSYLAGKDEKEIVRDRTAELSPMIRIIEESYADVLSMENSKFFTESQYRLKRSENVNMRAHNLWNRKQGDNPWKIVDPCYMHLQDEVTQMKMELHPVDSRTGGIPKPANTVAARARYSQRECLPACLIQWNMSMDGYLVPDFSSVCLIATYSIVEGRAFVVLHKVVNAKSRRSCLDIPLVGNREDQFKIQYEAAPENEMLIPDLINDEGERSGAKDETASTVEHVENGNERNQP